MIMGEFGWWNLWILASRVRGQIPDALDSIANAAASKCPLLQVSSTRDSVVRVKYQQQVFEAYAGEKSIVTRPEADRALRKAAELGRMSVIAYTRQCSG